MLKELVLDSATIRRSGDLRIARISANRCDASRADCRVRHGKGTLRRVLRDMLVICEFETMRDEFEAPPHVLNSPNWINPSGGQ